MHQIGQPVQEYPEERVRVLTEARASGEPVETVLPDGTTLRALPSGIVIRRGRIVPPADREV